MPGVHVRRSLHRRRHADSGLAPQKSSRARDGSDDGDGTNFYGMVAAAMASTADGCAEREAAPLMLEQQRKGRRRRITVGADKAFDSKDFIQAARKLNVIVHVTKNEKGRRSNLDRRTTWHAVYAIILGCRWLIEKGQWTS